MGWTPRLTANTRQQAEIRENQERVVWGIPRSQSLRWSDRRRMEAKVARLRMVTRAEVRYRDLLLKWTRR